MQKRPQLEVFALLQPLGNALRGAQLQEVCPRFLPLLEGSARFPSRTPCSDIVFAYRPRCHGIALIELGRTEVRSWLGESVVGGATTPSVGVHGLARTAPSRRCSEWLSRRGALWHLGCNGCLKGPSCAPGRSFVLRDGKRSHRLAHGKQRVVIAN